MTDADGQRLAMARRLERVCSHFEKAWKTVLPEEAPPRIEDYLDGCPTAECAAVLQELIALDVHYRRRSGEVPAPADYQARFPALGTADLVRLLDASTASISSPPEHPAPRPNAAGAAPADASGFDFLAPAQGPDEIGRLAHYRVLRVLGQGGMGVVFHAEDTLLERPVALKVMRPEVAGDLAYRQRFLREARATAAIKDDHVVTIHQVGEDNGVPFLVMEFLHGVPLDRWLAQGGQATLAQVLRLGAEMARGLSAAHARGLVHRDIKPSNIWLEAPAGRVKLLDFGLARPLRLDVQLTQSGMVVGTPAYMAPEQARAGPVDARTDLYSLGCVLYRLCTGRLPFETDDTMALLTALAVDQPPSVAELNPELPEALTELVMQMLAKQPAQRPASAQEVAEQLQSISREPAAAVPPLELSGPDTQAETIDVKRPVPAPRRSRLRGRWLGGIAAGLAAVAILVVLLAGILRNRDAESRPLASTADTLNDPAFLEWMERVSMMSGQEQLDAVMAKLQDLNPQFDGKVERKNIEAGVVTELWFHSDHVKDISPVRALPGLKVLGCHATVPGISELADLSPLKGMNLTVLGFNYTQVADLSPLQGMPLTNLGCEGTKVTNLSPLKDMPLTYLFCSATQVTDLRPLKDMRLEGLWCARTKVRDLSPLRDVPLTELDCGLTEVRDLSPLTKMPLKKLSAGGCNRITDLKPLKDIQLTILQFGDAPVDDLSPLKGMPLEELSCYNTRVNDLTPLKGMRLTSLNCERTQVSDLTPLKGMQLKTLWCHWSLVTDLSPLEGMPLTTLGINQTQVDDLSPLRGMNLTEVFLTAKAITKGMEVLREMKSLQTIGPGFDGSKWVKFPADKFWKKLDAGEFGTAGVGGKKPADTLKDPAFIQWVQRVSKMSGQKQLEAVMAKLQDLNPHFDGKVEKRNIEAGEVTGLWFLTDHVTDISPVRALTRLEQFGCRGSTYGAGALVDLSPLHGMQLTALDCSRTQVTDLRPLKDMPLKGLWCDGTKVKDLSPLRDVPLEELYCGSTQVEDLSPLTKMPLKTLDAAGCFRLTDLKPLKGMQLTILSLRDTPVDDLSPLKGMRLKELFCWHTQVNDLTPLKGMRLTSLWCSGTQVSDLTPLKGMELKSLACAGTRVADLSPLEGMPLTFLSIELTQVDDLSPLRGMNLTEVEHTPKSITKGMDVLRQMKSLKYLGLGLDHARGVWVKFPTAEFWKKLDAGEFGTARLGAKKPADTLKDPAFIQWVKRVSKMSGEKQLDEVMAKLKELNPHFDGKVERKNIEAGEVTGLWFFTDHVTDISPVRALTRLEQLGCHGSTFGAGALVDLSPLDGMQLTALSCNWTEVTDLRPLKNMPLTGLWCEGTKIKDLSPLRDMPLTYLLASSCYRLTDLKPLKGMQLTSLHFQGTPVDDLSPLKGMPLEELECWYTKVKDLTPLKGMKLKTLWCGGSRVADLSPLEGMPLTSLYFNRTQVNDVSPLRGMNLTEVFLTPKSITKGMDVLRQMKSLKYLGLEGSVKFRAAEFWNKLDAGEFNTAGVVAKKPADTLKDPAFIPYGDISDLKLARPEDRQDVKGTPPPEGALVLFNGKSLDGWTTIDGKKPTWKLLDSGAMEVASGGNIITEKKFSGAFKLHVEFRVPYLPTAQGQARGNSGVYVQGRYELQVLDSYGLESTDGDCGGIYGIAAPRVNACKAPTVWQSYDIEFHAPKCVDAKKTEMGRISVWHNGVKIHDDLKLTQDNTLFGLGGDPCTPGPIMLQEHGNPVQFRNIWLVPMKK
jgi:serine/threonine protein kinase/Leucine-rich repeat (LRR) protein